MNEILPLVISIATKLPSVLSDVESAYKKVEADPQLQIKVRDALSGLEAVLKDLLG